MEEDDIKLEELKKADLSEVSTIFKDEILLNVTCTKPELYYDDTRIFIDADEVSIEYDGKDTFIRVWWD